MTPMPLARPGCWACICGDVIKLHHCQYHTRGEHPDLNCSMDKNPNYNCEYRHIDIEEMLRNTIPKRKKDVPI